MSAALRTALAYAALATVTLLCLKVASLAPLVVDWGRELAAGSIALVAVVVGMRLARSPPAPSAVVEPEAEPPSEGILTPRERQILRLLDQGLTNKELAAQLGVSENTVKSHLANLYAKLGVGRRTEALASARRSGWLG